MKLNLSCGRRCLQIIFWLHPLDICKHWAFKPWRWPNKEIRTEVAARGLRDFGFRALSLGPIEFRYWKFLHKSRLES